MADEGDDDKVVDLAEKRKAKAKAPPKPKKVAVDLSDQRLSGEVVERYQRTFRYVAVWKQWLIFADDVGVWVFDQLNAVRHAIAEICAEIAVGLDHKDVHRLRSTSTMRSVDAMAQTRPELAALADQWDAEPMVINCRGMVIALDGNGSERYALPGDYFTKTTRVRPGNGGGCPLWLEFLELVTGGDTDLMEFLQRLAGYCLSGSTKEQVMFFLFGPGGNGKSTFVNTIANIMGDYATNAPMDMLALSQNDRHPADLARLQGARLVTASETGEGRRWDETKLKQLTGGDMISARFMGKDFFDYRPAFKLLVSGNHKPELHGVDDALKRRVRIVPFVVKIPEEQRVLDFEKRLEPEWPAILAWMIRGVGYWAEQGLDAPAAVNEATEEYFEQEDVVGSWLEECTEVERDHPETGAMLFKSWTEYTKRTGEWTGKQKALMAALKKRPELRYYRTAKSRGFYGRRIKADDQTLWRDLT